MATTICAMLVSYPDGVRRLAAERWLVAVLSVVSVCLPLLLLLTRADLKPAWILEWAVESGAPDCTRGAQPLAHRRPGCLGRGAQRRHGLGSGPVPGPRGRRRGGQVPAPRPGTARPDGLAPAGSPAADPDGSGRPGRPRQVGDLGDGHLRDRRDDPDPRLVRHRHRQAGVVRRAGHRAAHDQLQRPLDRDRRRLRGRGGSDGCDDRAGQPAGRRRGGGPGVAGARPAASQVGPARRQAGVRRAGLSRRAAPPARRHPGAHAGPRRADGRDRGHGPGGAGGGVGPVDPGRRGAGARRPRPGAGRAASGDGATSPRLRGPGRDLLRPPGAWPSGPTCPLPAGHPRPPGGPRPDERASGRGAAAAASTSSKPRGPGS